MSLGLDEMESVVVIEVEESASVSINYRGFDFRVLLKLGSLGNTIHLLAANLHLHIHSAAILLCTSCPHFPQLFHVS